MIINGLQTFELLPDVGHLLVDAFLLQFADTRAANVRDELHDVQKLVQWQQTAYETWVRPLIFVAMVGS